MRDHVAVTFLVAKQDVEKIRPGQVGVFKSGQGNADPERRTSVLLTRALRNGDRLAPGWHGSWTWTNWTFGCWAAPDLSFGGLDLGPFELVYRRRRKK